MRLPVSNRPPSPDPRHDRTPSPPRPSWPGRLSDAGPAGPGDRVARRGHRLRPVCARRDSSRESELMSGQEVSRTSIREAMKVLAAKGLVEIRQKTGTRVRPLDLWNVFDADVLRWHLRLGRGGSSCGISSNFARRSNRPRPAWPLAGPISKTSCEFDHAVCGMRDGVGDLDAYSRADVAFHMAVFGASHNLLFARLSHLVADFLEISFHLQQQALNEDDNRIRGRCRGSPASLRGDPARGRQRRRRTHARGRAEREELPLSRPRLTLRDGTQAPPLSPSARWRRRPAGFRL